jgi:hypothetical protein
MVTEPQPTPSLDARQAFDGQPDARRAAAAPRGLHGANPLHLHAEELDVLRCLQASGQPAETDDPVWDELEALGLVEMQAATTISNGSAARCGMLTSLGRRYRTD